MKQRWRPQLPVTGWSTPFALLLVVVPIEFLVLLYLQAASQHAVAGDFVSYQWFLDLWTLAGRQMRGLAFDFMRLNVLFVAYAWVMARSTTFRVHRWALVAAALVLAGVQLLWLASCDLARARFVLVPLEN